MLLAAAFPHNGQHHVSTAQSPSAALSGQQLQVVPLVTRNIPMVTAPATAAVTQAQAQPPYASKGAVGAPISTLNPVPRKLLQPLASMDRGVAALNTSATGDALLKVFDVVRVGASTVIAQLIRSPCSLPQQAIVLQRVERVRDSLKAQCTALRGSLPATEWTRIVETSFRDVCGALDGVAQELSQFVHRTGSAPVPSRP